MAEISDNLPIKKGSAADWTFYQRNGKTIGRQKRQSHNPSSGRTVDRMKTRLRWNNLLNAWRELGPELRGLFETKKPGLTDYNAFMGQNMPLSTVFVPNKNSGERICVAENYVVSLGSLMPSIELVEKGDVLVSSLRVGDLVLTEDTRQGQLAYEIVRHSEGAIRNGDEIQMVVVWQNSTSIRAVSAILSLETSVQTTFRGTGWLDFLAVSDGCLAVRRQEDMLVALVQRRVELDERGKARLRVTSQRLVGSNSLVRLYSNEKAMLEALESYDNYLLPNYSAPTPNTGAFARGECSQSNGVFPQTEKAVSKVRISAEVVPERSGLVIDGRGEDVDSGFVPIGSEITLRAVAAPGYRFLCWDTGERNPWLRIKVDDSMTLKAIFAPEE